MHDSFLSQPILTTIANWITFQTVGMLMAFLLTVGYTVLSFAFLPALILAFLNLIYVIVLFRYDRKALEIVEMVAHFVCLLRAIIFFYFLITFYIEVRATEHLPYYLNTWFAYDGTPQTILMMMLTGIDASLSYMQLFLLREIISDVILEENQKKMFNRTRYLEVPQLMKKVGKPGESEKEE